MSRSTILILTGSLAVVLWLIPVQAAPGPDPAGSNVAVIARSAADSLASTAERPVVNPLMPRITALMEQERAQLSDLEQQFRQAADEETALAIQARIREVKTGTELALLRLQLEEAGRRGDEDLAARLEQAITAITAPPPPPVFVDREVPDTRRN